jgi:hypothetical protein
MADNIEYLNVVTRIDMPAERVLKGALEAGVTDAVICGWDAEGAFYFASNKADGAEVLWLLELAKKFLLEEGAD